MTAVAAIDFGATSVRVCRVDLAGAPQVEVVHRHPHQPVARADGSLRWDWDRLVAEAEIGLAAACARGPVASIGVDAWGVDYGVVDHDGRLLSAPHSYRSRRTDGYRTLVSRVGERALYERAGLQLQPFNTIFQLAAHDPTELARAAHVLLLPDLLVWHLTGSVGAERTAAGTTGLLDVHRGTWADDLVEAVGVPRAALPPLVEPGAAAGAWRGIPVHRVGGHDTASAVVGATLGPASAFIATGTWLLVGREQAVPDTSRSAQAANFTNEQGVGGGIRFLKNVAGFWLIEACRRAWGDPAMPDLLQEAAGVVGGYRPFDATHARFLAPGDMQAEIRRAGAVAPGAGRAVVVRAAVASMARTAAAVVDALTGVDELVVFGGGAGVDLLRTELHAATGRPVRIGPTEAAAVGNALVQGVAIGRYADLAEARAAVAR